MQKEEKDFSIKHLAHDLNNIFTRILTSIELLKLKNNSGDMDINLLDNIQSGTYLASELINTTIGNSSSSVNKRRINANSIIQDIVKSYKVNENAKVKFNLSLQPNLNFINISFVDFYRILMNLITNSIESIRDKGTITITTINKVEAGLVQITIDDNGKGIDDNLYKLIFSEGFTTKSQKTNSGFGLNIVKGLVEKHNGTIGLYSQIEVGTRFIITFPSAPIKKERTSKKRTILIAEDDFSLLSLLTELFESYNYNVIPSSTGLEVLNSLRENKFDILIIDNNMPELDGINCINEIRKQGLTTPIVLATGSLNNEENSLADLNIAHIINKPYNFEELIGVIEKITE